MITSAFSQFSGVVRDAFEKVTLASISGYCSTYMTECSYIDLVALSGERCS